MANRSCVTRFPPKLMLMKQFVGEFTSCLILMTLGELFISAKHDNARPFLKTLYFLHLKASKRVGA